MASTRLVYQEDSYLKEINAKVVEAKENKLILDQTVFHPRSGGVDCDKGWVRIDGAVVEVENVYYDKETGEVVHELRRPVDLSPGSLVKLIINWDRRYRLMRQHTAAHILSAIMYNEYGAMITGGNISEEYAYDDYSIDTSSREIFLEAVAKANEIARRGIEVKVYWLPREEALKIPGVVKLMNRAPPQVEYLRIVEIPGVDIQADGGPHVRNTSEIGEIVLLKVENKGKMKKRIYFTVR